MLALAKHRHRLALYHLAARQIGRNQIFSENNSKRRGWGAVRVQATIGETTWQTSIFPHSKINAYILPIKAYVRKEEKILADNMVEVQLKIEV